MNSEQANYIRDHVGLGQTYVQAAEELAELIQAISKIHRLGTVNEPVMTKEQVYQNANEELADVENILEVLKLSPWYSEVMNHEIREAKMQRWVARIQAVNNTPPEFDAEEVPFI